jgi:hypothetical protein
MNDLVLQGLSKTDEIIYLLKSLYGLGFSFLVILICYIVWRFLRFIIYNFIPL